MNSSGFASGQASEKPCLLSGKERNRVSVAAKMALAMAGRCVTGRAPAPHAAAIRLVAFAARPSICTAPHTLKTLTLPLD
jgi:hypothetical protein